MASPMLFMMSEASELKGKWHFNRHTGCTKQQIQLKSSLYLAVVSICYMCMCLLWCGGSGVNQCNPIINHRNIAKVNVSLVPRSVKAWSPLSWIRLKSSPPSMLKNKKMTYSRD